MDLEAIAPANTSCCLAFSGTKVPCQRRDFAGTSPPIALRALSLRFALELPSSLLFLRRLPTAILLQHLLRRLNVDRSQHFLADYRRQGPQASRRFEQCQGLMHDDVSCSKFTAKSRLHEILLKPLFCSSLLLCGEFVQVCTSKARLGVIFQLVCRFKLYIG